MSAQVTAGNWYAVRVTGLPSPNTGVFGGSAPSATSYSYAGSLSIIITGACCNPNTGQCPIRTAAGCAADGGDYQGDGTTCTASTCVGRCCDVDGSCSITPPNGCPAGTFGGNGTTCQGPQSLYNAVTDLPAAIFDNNLTGITRPLVITDSYPIADLDLSFLLNPAHTFYGDIGMRLRHVDTGTTVTVMDGLPNDSSNVAGPSTLDDETATTFDAAAAAAPGTGDTIPAGSYRPDNPLSAFDGENIGGTWELTVFDDASIDTETVAAWPSSPASRSSARSR